jgi:CheY-like chemotaxis protein
MSRILLVDDDENQRLLYREDLEAEGYEVIEAGDGREALQRLDDGRPDLVVLDINLPGMDGLHTLTRIHDRTPRLPIIINSAHAHYREQFVSWIAEAYVVKSSNTRELREAIRQALAARARTRTDPG